jgi:hypothetical protein
MPGSTLARLIARKPMIPAQSSGAAEFATVREAYAYRIPDTLDDEHAVAEHL